MLHQFHDICAGCGLRDVHREAEEALTACADRVDALARRWAAEALELQPRENSWTLVNTLPFERRAWVTLPDGREGIVTLPPHGTRTVTGLTQPDAGVCCEETADGWQVGNGVIRFALDRDGHVTGLTDERTGLPLQDDGMVMNDLRLYKDVEPIYDAW